MTTLASGENKTSFSAHAPERKQIVTAGLELTFAGMLWGFGFIAVIWALRGMGPLSITGWRFALAAVAGLGITLAIKPLRKQMEKEQFFLAMIPGLLISLSLILQTWGLKHTTATKSGFITTLYVLFVPVMEKVWFKRRLPKRHYFYVFLALIGVALICDLPGELMGKVEGGGANFGDFLTLLCAIAASFQILWFGKIAPKIKSSFTFNNFQSVWAGIIPLLLSFAFEPFPTPSFADNSMWGLASLAFGSTLIAFALQVRAQKIISPSVASLLFLLESPFATLFAILFLNESLRTIQWFGAGLILVSAGLATVFGKEATEAPLPQTE